MVLAECIFWTFQANLQFFFVACGVIIDETTLL